MNRTCSPGEYEIFVSVGLMDGTPVFELPGLIRILIKDIN